MIMSTYQHEQYYVHTSTKGATKETLEKVIVLLIENNWHDYEFANDELVVDGFESEDEARCCDEIIGEYLMIDCLY